MQQILNLKQRWKPYEIVCDKNEQNKNGHRCTRCWDDNWCQLAAKWPGQSSNGEEVEVVLLVGNPSLENHRKRSETLHFLGDNHRSMQPRAATGPLLPRNSIEKAKALVFPTNRCVQFSRNWQMCSRNGAIRVTHILSMVSRFNLLAYVKCPAYNSISMRILRRPAVRGAGEM